MGHERVRKRNESGDKIGEKGKKWKNIERRGNGGEDREHRG